MSVSTQMRGIWGLGESGVDVLTLDAGEPRRCIPRGDAGELSDPVERVLSESATEVAASDPMAASQYSASATLNSSQTREKTSNTRASRSSRSGGGGEGVSVRVMDAVKVEFPHDTIGSSTSTVIGTDHHGVGASKVDSVPLAGCKVCKTFHKTCIT